MARANRPDETVLRKHARPPWAVSSHRKISAAKIQLSPLTIPFEAPECVSLPLIDRPRGLGAKLFGAYFRLETWWRFGPKRKATNYPLKHVVQNKIHHLKPRISKTSALSNNLKFGFCRFSQLFYFKTYNFQL